MQPRLKTSAASGFVANGAWEMAPVVEGANEVMGVRAGRLEVEAVLCRTGCRKEKVRAVGGEKRVVFPSGEDGTEYGGPAKLDGTVCEKMACVGVVLVDGLVGGCCIIDDRGESSSGVGGGRDGVIVVICDAAAMIDAREARSVEMGGGRIGVALIGLCGGIDTESVDCLLRCLLKLRNDRAVGDFGLVGLAAIGVLTGLEMGLPGALSTELLRVDPLLLLVLSVFPPIAFVLGRVKLVYTSGAAYSATSFLSVFFSL